MTRAASRELKKRRLVWPPTVALGKLFYAARQRPSFVDTIAFFKFGALGDVILTTPLVAAVRTQYPQAKLTYITAQLNAPALVGNPNLDRIITFADYTSFMPRLISLVRLIRQLRREKFNVVMVLDRAWPANLLGRLLGQFTIGFDRLGEGFPLDASVPYGYETHATAPHDMATYLATGALLGCSRLDHQPQFTIPTRDVVWAKRTLASLAAKKFPIVAVCPGGARNLFQPMPQRRWPRGHFETLVKQLTAQGFSIALLGDHADAADAQKIAAQVPTDTVKNFCGRTTLAQAGALLAQCSAVVVADTALLHLAATTTTPIIALFGPTNPRRKAPTGPHHQTLWKALPCPRCQQTVCHWERRAPHVEARASMAAISVNDVMQAVQQILATQKNESPT